MKKRSGFLTTAALLLCSAMLCFSAWATETITYYHNDIAGTPILATDVSGNVLWKENYQPYGTKLNNPTASAGNKVGFAGKPYDNNTGLSYMGARYYDPVIGRFTGIDPKGFDEGNLHSFNRYAYGNNNPYRFVDPDGRTAVEAAVAAVLYGVVVYAPEILAGTTFVAAVAGGAPTPTSEAAVAGNVAAKQGVAIVEGNIYRAASGTAQSMTPRAKDVAGLSAANSLENALPGKNQIIDTSRLKELCAVCDNLKTGHVSIFPKDMAQMQGWIESRGQEVHKFTKELMDAVVGTTNK